MQLHPTRNAVDLTFVGVLLVAVGVALENAAILAWGGAIIVGLQIARAVTLSSVARVRSAGFEMLWSAPERVARIAYGRPLELSAEVRNRDSRAARYVELRALHSPYLELSLEPSFGEVPAGGRLAVKVTVTGKRVGRHGIFGLSLEVQGSPGLYEVPLTFANPFGIEVMPGAYASYARTARGGRSHRRADLGRPGKRRGGQDELRELRDYASGDPLKRVAWRASARRGKLTTKEYDLEERDVVWVLLDASVELWAGVPGQAPLDVAIERCARLIEQHATRADLVGLAIMGARRLAWFPPKKGPAHAATLLEALAFRTGTHSGDRSGLDEADVATRVLEHLRPLEPFVTDNLEPVEVDRIARRAALALKRAPFRCPAPSAGSPREQTLRHYLLSFGVDSPARLEPDRTRTQVELHRALKDTAAQRPRPSLVYVCAPVPDAEEANALRSGLRLHPRSQTEVRWVPTRLEEGIAEPGTPTEAAVRYAIALRAETARRAGEEQLRRAGVKLERAAPRRTPPATTEPVAPELEAVVAP